MPKSKISKPEVKQPRVVLRSSVAEILTNLLCRASRADARCFSPYIFPSAESLARNRSDSAPWEQWARPIQQDP